MLRDGLDHPKTLDLSARLDIGIPQTIGHLELLWAFVAQKTPRGNIGKWPNGAIARSAQWQGDPDTFVNALCDAGFIDVHDEYRYVIHDWHEHAPKWVKSKLSRAGETFATIKFSSSDYSPDSGDNYSNDYSADYSSDYSPDYSADSKPSLAKPSQEKKKNKQKKSEYSEAFEQAWQAYPNRSGGNSKVQAFKAWQARIRDGCSEDELAAGVRRYAAFSDATGKTGTEFVKQAASFFGPAEHFREEWRAPKKKTKPDFMAGVI